ncbi:MAG: biopolymer transporter ExbD [Crocinitomicaceae bacterium]|nr:biopolymer transporter ExbD [Crocinitomicaceae bacterium]
MSKFRKGGKKDVPGVNTSALPDIVFMLLFFFMVATTMKEVDMLVEIEIPEGSSVTDITSLKQLNEVDFLYIGKPLEGGDRDVIQLDGELTISVLRVAKWKLEKVQSKERDIQYIVTSMKIDEGVRMGLVSSVKESLRDINALKICYAAKQKINN